MTRTIVLQDAETSDLDLLWNFLAIAAHEPDVAAARKIPVVAAHLNGWRGAKDFGLLAFMDGEAVGAAWGRQFLPAENPTYYHGPDCPELSISVIKRARGNGVGGTLLAGLVEKAQTRHVGLCLNVREDNAAVALYRAHGFVRVAGSEIINRVGGISFGMVLSPDDSKNIYNQ